MGLLDPPILFTLELHVATNGRVRTWTTPRNVKELPPAVRLLVAQALEHEVDQVFGLLGVSRRVEVVTQPLTVAQAKAVLG